MRFAAEKGLPNRRTEVQLALIALTVARAVGGNKDLTLDDFMIEKTETKKSTTSDSAFAISTIAGVSVRKLGQGRKKK